MNFFPDMVQKRLAYFHIMGGRCTFTLISNAKVKQNVLYADTKPQAEAPVCLHNLKMTLYLVYCRYKCSWSVLHSRSDTNGVFNMQYYMLSIYNHVAKL